MSQGRRRLEPERLPPEGPRQRPGEERGPGSEGGDQRPRLRGPWWFRRRRELTEEQREDLLSQLFFEGPDRGPFLRRFSILLALSVLIAVFGLASDSGPVVIGAMLISPLATPLLGLAAALVMGWPRRQLESVAILAGGTVGAVALAALALLLLPEPREITIESQELLSRTEPGLLDLGIAIVAGAAGAYVLVRREAIGALPGVAIAVALVPPVSTTGMMLELGQPDLAAEAILLYATNVAGIVLVASLVLIFAGMRPQTIHGRLTRRAQVGVGAAAIAVLAVAYPLAVETGTRIREATNHDLATRIVTEWIESADQSLHLHSIEVDGGSVSIEIAGPDPPPPLEPLADELATELAEEISLQADWSREERIEAEGAPP